MDDSRQRGVGAVGRDWQRRLNKLCAHFQKVFAKKYVKTYVSAVNTARIICSAIVDVLLELREMLS